MSLARQSAFAFAHELSDGSPEWYTPPRIFEALGLEFDLDPCAPVGGLPWIPAKRFLSRADDGLAQPWEGRVWLNPPYGDETGLWLDRLVGGVMAWPSCLPAPTPAGFSAPHPTPAPCALSRAA